MKRDEFEAILKRALELQGPQVAVEEDVTTETPPPPPQMNKES